MTETNTKSGRSFRDGVASIVTDSVIFGGYAHLVYAGFVGSRFAESLQDPKTLQASVAAATVYGVYQAGKCAFNYFAGRRR